jgi:hypothetical protein
MEGNLGFGEGNSAKKRTKTRNFTLPKWKHWSEPSLFLFIYLLFGYNSRHDRRIKMSEEGFTEIRQKTELSSPLSQETKRRRVKDDEVILLYFLWWFQ